MAMSPAEYRQAIMDLQAQNRAQISTLVQQTEALLNADWQAGMAAAPDLYRPLLDNYAKALADLRSAADDPAAKLDLSWLTNQNTQLASIEASVKASVDKYAAQSLSTVSGAQSAGVAQGAAHAAALTQQSLFPATEAGADPALLFNRPNPDALAALIGNIGDGHPLGDLFQNWSAEETSAARQVLMTGLLQGANPRTMVTGLSQAMDIPRQRALVIARTETLNAYRSAALENYRANSDVLNGWQWSAGGANPCACCMGMDGLIFTLEEFFEAHANCKCSPLPVTKSWDQILGPLGIDTSGMPDYSIGDQYIPGVERFERMAAADQRAIIGTNAGYQLVRDGKLGLRDFIGERPDGRGLYQRSLKDIQLGRNGVDIEAMVAQREATLAADRAAFQAGETAFSAGKSAASKVSKEAMAELRAAQKQVNALRKAYEKLRAADRFASLQDPEKVEEALFRLAKAQARVDLEVGGRGAVIISMPYDAPFAGMEKLAQRTEELFGRALTRDELAGLVGAPEGSFVEIHESAEGISFLLHGPSWNPLDVLNSGEEYSAERELIVGRGNALHMVNVNFALEPELQGQGLGLRIFGDEVDNLSKLGVKYIETSAAGDAEYAGLNGYYTWPRFGYVGKLPEDSVQALKDAVERGELPTKFGKYTTIQQVMKSEEGRIWWKANGQSLSLKFDLKPNSASMKVLRAYQETEVAAAEAERVAAEQAAAREAGGVSTRDLTRAEVNKIIKDASFSVERVDAEQLTQEADRAMHAINPSQVQNLSYEAGSSAASEAKAKVAADLASRLADNPDFMKVGEQIQAMLDEHPDLVQQFNLFTRGSTIALDTPEDIASALVKSWAQGDNPLYPALKQAVKDEFNLKNLSRQSTRAVNREAKALFADVQPGLRAFVREMYNSTQDWLRANDIAEVPVYRGVAYVKLPKGLDASLLDGQAHELQLALNSASSFTADAEMALTFAQNLTYKEGDGIAEQVIAARVPRELILSTPQTGFGSMAEHEVVALGGTYDVVGVGVDNTALFSKSGDEIWAMIRAGEYNPAKLDIGQVDTLLEKSAAEATARSAEVAETAVEREAVGATKLGSAAELKADEKQLLKSVETKTGFSDHVATSKAVAARLEDNPEFQRLAQEVWNLRDVQQFDQNYRGFLQAYDKLSPEERTAGLLATRWEAGLVNPLGLSMQQAIKEEFGLGDALFNVPRGWAAGVERYQQYMPGIRAWARAQYEETQTYLASKGVDELTLWRGLAWKSEAPEGFVFDDTVRAAEMALRPATSFSADSQTALLFTDSDSQTTYRLLTATRVPASDVFSVGATGLGSSSEGEIIVLGGTRPVAYLGVDLPTSEASKAWYQATSDTLFERFAGQPLTEAAEATARSAEVAETAVERGASFSIERVDANVLAQETERAKDLIHATPNARSYITMAEDAKARVSADLGQRLADNTEFAKLREPLIAEREAQLRNMGMSEDRIARELADVATSPEQMSSTILRAWADGDTALYPALQKSIEQEFNLADISQLADTNATRDALATWADYQPGLQSFVREMYNSTQDWLKANDINEIPIYRGMGWKTLPKSLDRSIFDNEARDITVELRAASSFSADSETALQFAEYPVNIGQSADYQQIIAARVPSELILSTPQTGFGTLDEYEVVVLGGRADAVSLAGRIVAADESIATPESVEALLAHPISPLETAVRAAQRDVDHLTEQVEAAQNLGNQGRVPELMLQLDDATERLEAAQQALAEGVAREATETAGESLARSTTEREAIATVDREVANQAIRDASFTVARADAEKLAKESDNVLSALNPAHATETDTSIAYKSALDARAQVVSDLGEALAENQEYLRVGDKLTELYEEQLREKGYAEVDIARMVADRAANGPLSSEQIADELLNAWIGGENVSSRAALQQAIRDEFGLVDAAPLPNTPEIREALAQWQDAQPGLRVFVREMYNNTQDYLKANDIAEVPIYRGIGFETLPKEYPSNLFDGAPHDLELSLRPASSFSADASAAAAYAGHPVGVVNVQYQAVIATRVPSELVLSVPRTGFGLLSESEVVTLGGDVEARIVGTDIQAMYERMVTEGIDPHSVSTQDAINLLTNQGAADQTAFAASQAEVNLTHAVASYDLTAEDQAFVADLKQQILALDHAALTRDDAMAIGGQLHDRINASLTEFEDYAAQAKAILDEDYYKLTAEQAAWLSNDPDAIAAHGGMGVREARAQYQAEFQARVLTYLQEVRDMGGTDIRLTVGAPGFDLNASEAVARSREMVPTDWIQASNDLGDLTVIRNADLDSAGWYNQLPGGGGKIALDTQYDAHTMQSMALHEYMHRMESVLPQIGQMEKAFYESRTLGDAAVQLRNGIDAQTKLDTWPNEYLGRLPITYRNGLQSYELLSMGAEMLMGGGDTYDLLELRQDEEFVNFVLGVFSTVRADAASGALSTEAEDALSNITNIADFRRDAETAFSAAAKRDVTYADDAVLDRISARLDSLDRPLTDTEVANIAGAPSGTQVAVNKYGDIITTAADGSTTEVSIQALDDVPGGAVILDWARREADETVIALADPDMLAMQIRQANKLGIAKIVTKAHHVGDDWALLGEMGYDAPIGQVILESKAELPEALKGAASLQDVLATDEGRAWWAEYGNTPNLEFDVRPGSRSRKIFNRWLRSHSMRGIR